MGGEANARDAICTDVRYTLKLKTSEFQNCTISKGSVVVSFNIVQNPTETAETQNLLQDTVKNDGFTVTTLNGTRLTTKTDSVIGDNEENDEADDDDNMMIIIIGAVAAAVLIIIIVVIIVVCMVKKRQQVHDSEEVR